MHAISRYTVPVARSSHVDKGIPDGPLGRRPTGEDSSLGGRECILHLKLPYDEGDVERLEKPIFHRPFVNY